LNLICISNFQLGLFGSLYFIGFVVGALTLLRLGDTLGRKPVLMFTSISYMILFLLFYFANSLVFVYTLLFISGVLGIARGSLFYMYMLELIPAEKRSTFHGILMSIESIGGILTSVLFYYVQDARVAFLIMFGVTVFHFNFLVR
jgi:MFS family permease